MNDRSSEREQGAAKLAMPDLARRYGNKTVVLTGAGGYLASALIEGLKGTAARILRVSRSDLAPAPGQESIKADVRSQESWAGIVAKADVIFHLAGNTSVYAAARDPVESLNSTVLPITHLVAAAQAAGRRPRVVFASTATVYGLTDDLPVSEDAPTEPVTTYDLHKLFAEKQLALASRQGILEGVSLRICNVYGPSSGASSAEDRGILNKLTRAALQGARLKVFGDGNYVRDYLYIGDVVRAFMAAGVGEALAGCSYNVASGTGITLRDAFRLVGDRAEKLTGKTVHIDQVPWPEGADPIEFRNFVGDIRRFRDSTGWRPEVSLEEGIDRMIAFYLRGPMP